MFNKRLALAFLFAVTTWAADDPPSWLREIATTKPLAYPARIPAVVLWNEEHVNLEEGGKLTTTTRKAVRILNKEGRRQAFAVEQYLASAGKVKDLRAWMIFPSGEFKKYGKDRIIETALSEDSLYDEYRRKMISAQSDADEGAVFGYESVLEEKTAFTQFVFAFQTHLPALTSRFSLTLPAGWRAEGMTFNHAKVEPEVSGSTYTWELKRLSPVEEEASGPTHSAMVPRLAVTSFPAEGAKLGIQRSLADWTAVSRWMSELQDPQSVPTEEVSAKSRELTANAKTEYEKIQAIGSYVQNIRYVAIQTNLARGGGYRPHTAAEVLRKQYGDCKDKANLAKAMLQSVGITSHHLGIYSGDRTFVHPEWASPYQFNHDIIAVELKDDATQSPATLTHAQLGRLLVFDPTDPYTPVGDLPEHEQGSYALVVAGDKGALVKMPATSPVANRLERDTEIILLGDGSVKVKAKESTHGQAAVELRSRLRRHGREDFDKALERWISHGANSAQVSRVETSDAMRDGKFTMEVEFSAGHYAQLMQNRLLVFKPGILTRREGVRLNDDKRQHAVVLNAEAFHETVRVQLPEKFKVDEMPDPDKLETPFGKYSASWAVKDGALLFTRSLEVQSTTLPVEQYGAAKEFFERVYGADGAPVVLVRQ